MSKVIPFISKSETKRIESMKANPITPAELREMEQAEQVARGILAEFTEAEKAAIRFELERDDYEED